MPSVARRRRTVQSPISPNKAAADPAQIPEDEDESEEERIQSTQQNRRRAPPSEDESDEEAEEEGGDEEMADVEPDSQDQIVKKLVRYALACEYQRTSIKRVGITEKG
jgi:melanoma-associated antigen